MMPGPLYGWLMQLPAFETGYLTTAAKTEQQKVKGRQWLIRAWLGTHTVWPEGNVGLSHRGSGGRRCMRYP